MLGWFEVHLEPVDDARYLHTFRRGQVGVQRTLDERFPRESRPSAHGRHLPTGAGPERSKHPLEYPSNSQQNARFINGRF